MHAEDAEDCGNGGESFMNTLGMLRSTEHPEVAHTFRVFHRPRLNSAAPATAYVENAIATAT